MLSNFLRNWNRRAVVEKRVSAKKQNRAKFASIEMLEDRLVLANWSEQDELVPSTVTFPTYTGGDDLGRAVAIEGDTAVIGAPDDDSSRGSVYVFKRTGSTWTAVQRLTAADAAVNDDFGTSVSISGNTIVVGAPQDSSTGSKLGKAYVFNRPDAASPFNSTALPQFTGSSLIGDSTIHFGRSVSIDGDALVVGAPFDDKTVLDDNAGSISVFTRDLLGVWSTGIKFRPADTVAADEFGRVVAMSGNRIVVGAPGADVDAPVKNAAGAAYALERTGATIIPGSVQKLLAPDRLQNDQFGSAVDIDGSTLIVGSPFADFTSPAASNAGAAYVFVESSGVWGFQQKLFNTTPIASDNAGLAVAVQGDLAAVGAPNFDTANLNDGGVFVFSRSGSTWSQQDVAIIESDEGIASNQLGRSLAIDSGSILAGAPNHPHVGANSGAAYVFVDPNDAPSFTPGANQTEFEDSGSHTVVGWATNILAGPPDESGQTVHFELTGNTNPSLFSVVPAIATDGTLTYTAAADAFGTATITVVLKDNGGTLNGGVDTSAPAVFTITLTGINDAPTFAIAANHTSDEDDGAQTVAGFATAISAGPNESTQTVSFTVTGNTNPGLFVTQPSIAPDGTLTYAAAADANGSATITVELADDGDTLNGGVNTSVPAVFTIDVNAVNDPPANSVPGPQAVNEDEVLVFAIANGNAISVSDVDAGGADIEVTLAATNGVVSLGSTAGLSFAVGTGSGDATMTFQGTVAAINAALEGTTFAADADYFGPASLTITTDDLGNTGLGSAFTAEDTIAIMVDAVNDAPTMATAASHTSNEDGGAQSVSGFATASAGPANEAGQSIVYNITGNTNAALFVVLPTIAPDGTLTYTAAANANGSATITVEAMDDGGTANGGVDTSAPTVFTIIVDAVNDAPSFAIAASHASDEDAGAQSVSGFATAISAGPADESTQTPTFVVTGNTNPGLFSTAPTIAADGTLSYTAAANASGSATVTVKLTDDGGTANGGVNQSAEVSFTITVDPVNDLPTATAQAVNVTEDGQTTIVLSGSDLETATANLTFTIASVPTSGSLTFGGNPVSVGDTFVGPPSLDFVPAAGSNATSASFTFTVTDRGDPDNAPGDAAETSAPATVTINIAPAVAGGSVTLSDGIVRVGGTNNGDTMLVERINASTLRVTLNGVATNLPLASVTEVRVWGRSGADIITVDTDLSVPTTLDGGDGADMISGGNGADLIFGGGGIDLLFGNGGNDMIIGGDGADLLTGGAGHDVLVAGRVAPQFSIAMLRDIANAWATDRIADEGPDDGTLDESVVDTGFDILSGNSGADWFIINIGDFIIDYRPNGANGDVITYI